MKQAQHLRRHLATLLLLAVTTLTWAYDFEKDGIYYNTNTDGTSVTVTYKTTSYNSYSGSVIIPSTVTYSGTTYNVTSIGSSAFRSCTGLTSITIPESVSTIGSSAFSGCTGLASVTLNSNSIASKTYTSSSNIGTIFGSQVKEYVLGDDIKAIGDYAFRNCTSLTSITIPESVKSIGRYAFYGCTGLTSVTIPESVTSIGSSAFDGCTGLTKAEFASIESLCKIDFSSSASNPLCYAEHLYINGQEVKDLVIPNSVTNIGDNVFCNCSGLTSVTIGNSVTSIGKNAFYGCSGLTSVTIPNSVTDILVYAFRNCTSLTSVTIPESVTSIDNGAFLDCSNLASVTLNSNSIVSKTHTSSTFTSASNFRTIFGSQVKEYVLGDNITAIGSYAFSYCDALTSITIRNSVTSIGYYAFEGCTGLTAVTIGNSVTDIGHSAFYKCTGLTSVTLNSNSIASKTYTSSSNIGTIFGSQVKEYVLGDNITTIGSYAFYNCDGQTSVTIPNSVTSIGRYAFYGTPWYNNQPDGLVYAGKVAYEYKGTMPSGTDIVIKDGTLGIADYAFDECTGLSSVTIPESVTTIGEGTFSGCSGLTSIIIDKDNTRYDSRNDCNAIIETETNTLIAGCKNTVIPNSVTNIGNSAFSGCTDLTSVTIGNNVTSIGGSAFNGCQLQTIINHGDNDIEENTFSDRSYLHAQLYVPEGTIWDYIYTTRWGEFHHIKEFASSADDIRNDAVYMICDRSGRNFPVYDKSARALKEVAYTLNIDDSDTGACWQVIQNGSDTYLYNIGAGMYAAYDADDNLSLSTVPTALAIRMTEDGATINGKPVMLVANKSVTPVDNPTGIETLQSGETGEAAKQAAAIYDLQGRRLNEKPVRGFYIQGGKKHFVK